MHTYVISVSFNLESAVGNLCFSEDCDNSMQAKETELQHTNGDCGLASAESPV